MLVKIRNSRLRGVSRQLFLSFLFENTYCGYLWEAPLWSDFNEYSQVIFSWRNKLISILISWKKSLYLALMVFKIMDKIQIPCEKSTKEHTSIKMKIELLILFTCSQNIVWWCFVSVLDLLPITYKCIRLQLQLLCNFMITDYNYNCIFPECNQLQLQLHCNVIDYNYNYFLVVPCLKKF